MCGLVGCAGGISSTEVIAFKNMLAFSVVRGSHSTGVTVQRTDGSVSTFKRAMNSIDLMDSKNFDNLFKPLNVNVVIGHNRWATVGKAEHQNAHPFECGDITGCHNGTIDWVTRSDLEKYKECDTDSEALFWDINKNGIRNTISKVSGAWALVFLDHNNGTLNFLRNDQRELYYLFSKDKTVLFWASEPGFLTTALTRNNIDFDSKPVLLTENTLVTWKVPTHSKSAFDQPTRTKIEGKPKPIVTRGNGFGYRGSSYFEKRYGIRESVDDGFDFFVSSKHTTVVSEQKENTSTIENPEAKVQNTKEGSIVSSLSRRQRRKLKRANIAKTLLVYKGWQGEVLSQKEFENRFHTCMACDKTINWGDTVRFISSESVVCSTCMEDTLIVNALTEYSHMEQKDSTPVISSTVINIH